MPEMPEVETVKRQIQESMHNDNYIISAGKSQFSLRKEISASLPQILIQNRILETNRRGKYILISLQNGGILLLHLGMSGAIKILENKQSKLPYTLKLNEHLYFATQNKIYIFHDPRRFGLIEYYKELSEIPYLANLGPEILSSEFNLSWLKSTINRRSNKNAKSTLMDQSIFCGVGNIYASEILFLAQVHPFSIFRMIPDDKLSLIIEHAKKILTQSIEHKGTSIHTFNDTKMERGKFQQFLQVYNRSGKSCPSCNGIILEDIINQRSTFFCSHCQTIYP